MEKPLELAAVPQEEEQKGALPSVKITAYLLPKKKHQFMLGELRRYRNLGPCRV